MSAQKHSPGPWEIRERNAGRGHNYQIVGNSKTYGGSSTRYALAQCFQYPVGASGEKNQARANAFLIAAAPDLLIAARAALAALKEINKDHGVCYVSDMMLLQEAIDKAEGAQ